jgi:hypothetical protein
VRNTYLAVTPLDGYSPEQIFSFYGYQHGFQVVATTTFFTNWQNAENASTANKQAADTHYSMYLEQFEKNKKLNSIETKLRKACGSKCKKIKNAQSVSARMSHSSPEPALMTQDAHPDRGVGLQEYQVRLGSKYTPQN